VQRLRAGLPDSFIGPSAPEMRTGPDHWAKGLTAAKDASLTGRHLPRMLFVIEEACGVDPVFWHVVQTMFDPSLGHAQLCIFNPTDTTSQAYVEDQAEADADGAPRWHRFRLSALNHPNVLAELRGEPKPIPGAVSLQMVNELVRDWCEPVADPADLRATDFEWPPGSGRWVRPGPLFQCRAMGLWPDAGEGLWSDALFAACRALPSVDNPAVLPEVGCDTATGKGDDFFAVHGRWGARSVHHETSNTMDPVRIFARLKDVTALLASMATASRARGVAPVRPQQIPVKIDDDGTGNAVAAFLAADGYTVIPVGAGTTPRRPDLYPNKRSELWFHGAEKARAGLISLAGLDGATARRLKQQLMAPAWKLDGAGRRVVEPKDETKKKIGRSPDDADSFNLAHLPAPSGVMRAVEVERDPGRAEARRRIFGGR
jgi:hypothetical protein